MIKSKSDINAVSKVLEERYRTDEAFKQETDEIIRYYARKLLPLADSDTKKKYIEDELSKAVSSQFTLGYFLMTEILADPEFVLESATWTLSKGVIRNEVFDLLENVMSETESEWQRSDGEKKFTRHILDEIYPAYEAIVQMRKDTLAIGAYYAFIGDSRYQSAVLDEPTGGIASYTDFTFLNPQVYMQPMTVTESVQKWTLQAVNAVAGLDWLGDVQVTQAIDGNHTLFDIKLSDQLIQDERIEIVNHLIAAIPEEKHANTVIHFYVVSSFDPLFIESAGN